MPELMSCLVGGWRLNWRTERLLRSRIPGDVPYPVNSLGQHSFHQVTSLPVRHLFLGIGCDFVDGKVRSLIFIRLGQAESYKAFIDPNTRNPPVIAIPTPTRVPVNWLMKVTPPAPPTAVEPKMPQRTGGQVVFQGFYLLVYWHGKTVTNRI